MSLFLQPGDELLLAFDCEISNGSVGEELRPVAKRYAGLIGAGCKFGVAFPIAETYECEEIPILEEKAKLFLRGQRLTERAKYSVQLLSSSISSLCIFANARRNRIDQ